ncbi:hypothetical protein RCL_jg20055.t1 [Rhizophagus clarus]|uniref:Transmembrane protein n=1 Tax=Rhizophagus clarus TaxID=94130 RepID=A0A8H3QKV9_9GLOM|nr:hypothetical protein RCL_jg20055.t1 [Rhizophagus clarus]
MSSALQNCEYLHGIFSSYNVLTYLLVKPKIILFKSTFYFFYRIRNFVFYLNYLIFLSDYTFTPNLHNLRLIDTVYKTHQERIKLQLLADRQKILREHDKGKCFKQQTD